MATNEFFKINNSYSNAQSITEHVCVTVGNNKIVPNLLLNEAFEYLNR